MTPVFPVKKDRNHIASFLEQGIIKAHVPKIFDFEDIQAAHSQVESGSTAGKVVIRI